jgi:Protein  of unknown function (DUF3018)
MPITLSQRVRTHRDNLRKAGLRPIQIWVPDTRAPGFAKECARQSQAIRDSAGEQEDMDFIERITEDEWK